VTVQEHDVPDVIRDQHGEKPGDHVADNQFLSKHGEIRHGVAGGIGPGGLRRELVAPRLGLELGLMSFADTGHHLVFVGVVTGEPGPGLGGPAGSDDCPAGESQQHDHDRATDELCGGELPAHQHHQHDAELDDEVGRGEHEDHGVDEVGALREQRLGHCRGRVRTRRRDHPESARPGHGSWPVIAHQPLHLVVGDERLHRPG